MIHKFDELNINRKENTSRIESYREYFQVMDISEEEMEKRISLAEILEPVFIWFFLLFLSEQYTSYTLQFMLVERITLAVKDFFDVDYFNDYLKEYFENISAEIVNVTVENKSDSYYTSISRAEFIAANEANFLCNYFEYQEALKNGYRYKIWVTENDSRVRHTHKEVRNTKIDISKPFIVGESTLMFPKDFSLGAKAKETINCRCHIKFTKF